MDAQLRPTDSTTLPHPYTFSDRMRTHWIAPKPHGLGNVPSAALSRLWVTMGETFNRAIAGNPATANPFRDADIDTKWHVLSPPCGAGKTQGLRVYAAMLAKANLTLPTDQKVGTLIVVREIETANELADQINETFARSLGQTYPHEALNKEGGLIEVRGGTISIPALARHSQSPRTMTEGDIRSASVLIVTHASYVQALDRLTEDARDRWSTLIEWEHGQRRFVCVDESISNLVEDYQLELDSLRSTLGDIPQYIRERHPGQIERLSFMHRPKDRPNTPRAPLGQSPLRSQPTASLTPEERRARKLEQTRLSNQRKRAERKALGLPHK